MKPLIGITASIDDKTSLSSFFAYARAIERAGGLPLVLPYLETSDALDDFIAACDGIFLTGGMDIEPSRYGEEKHPKCGECQPNRDTLEYAVLSRALKADKPILAICRGHQLVNVYLGGTLYQHLPEERPSDIPHVQAGDPFIPSHPILIEDGSPLSSLIGKREMCGNSFHHQAVKTLGKGLTVTAKSPDGLIEGLTLQSVTYLRTYQWHPERLIDTDRDSLLLFEDFIAAAQRKKDNL